MQEKASIPDAGLTGGMKPTFLEGFSKIYTYPYGNSFLPREQSAYHKANQDQMDNQ